MFILFLLCCLFVTFKQSACNPGERMHSLEQITEPVLLAEGPHWDAKEEVLYYVDIYGFAVHKYDPKSKSHSTVQLNNTVGAVIPIDGNPGKFVIGFGANITILEWDGYSNKYNLHTKYQVDTDKPGNRFNDGKADAKGNLWFGRIIIGYDARPIDPTIPDMNATYFHPCNLDEDIIFRTENVTFEKIRANKKSNSNAQIVTTKFFTLGTMGFENPPGSVKMDQGTLYRISSTTCRLDAMVKSVSISNGIAWNSENNIMYYIDSPTRRIDAFDYHLETATIENRRTFFDFEKHNISGLPDGMTIDTDDNLWIACWSGGRVIQVSKEGKLLRSIELPVSRVTSVTWGGPNLDILYVTSMKKGLTEEQLKTEPAAGAVFSVTGLGVRGVNGNSVSNCLLT